ncbi:MAG TPA: hypothetical protein DEO32_06195 [Ruminococcaceae bacterium]|nr:hypothetical protein [Oscillospiraceae bacterium]
MIKEIMRKTTAVAVSVVITLSMLGAAVPAVSAASKKLTLSAADLSLTIGDTVDINQYYSDKSATNNVVYTSSNPNVADVRASNGFVTANKTGSATITATDKVSGHKASCKVSVHGSYIPATTTTLTDRWHKGVKGYADVLGIKYDDLISWLKNHDNKSKNKDYYIGTKFVMDDYRMPNGDRSSRYATGNYGLPTTTPQLNCTGFVWHVLQSVSKKKSLVPAETGWVSLYRDYNISRYYFTSKSAMLNSGLLEKGDIIWQFCTESEYYGSPYNHIGIYYGDGKSNVFWHSAGKANAITEVRGCGRDVTICVVVKAKPYNQLKLNRDSLSLGVNEVYGLLSNDTKNISWRSSNTSVARVDKNGRVTGVAPGSAVITVSGDKRLSASCAVTVKKAPESVKLNINSRTMGVGETYTLSETTNSGSYANAANLRWTSSDSKVVSVTKTEKTNKAVITAKGTGSATITLKTYNGRTAKANITVKKAPTKVSLNSANVILGAGEEFDFDSSVPAGQASSVVDYSSGNTKVATVRKSGGITKGVSPGTATITAKAFNGVTAKAKVTVKPAPSKVTLSTSKATLGAGERLTISETTNSGTYANASNLVWSSSNNAVATVKKGSGNKAEITAVSPGTANVTIKLYNGKTASAAITVKQAPVSMKLSVPSLEMGLGEVYTILECTNSGSYSSAPTIKWSSSDESVVSVKKGSANKADLTAKSSGTAVITAETYNGVTATAVVTVKNAPRAVVLSENEISLEPGQTFDLAADLGEDCASANTSFTSGNPISATVGANGKITALKPGRAVITVKTYNGKSAVCVVTVSEPAGK